MTRRIARRCLAFGRLARTCRSPATSGSRTSYFRCACGVLGSRWVVPGHWREGLPPITSAAERHRHCLADSISFDWTWIVLRTGPDSCVESWVVRLHAASNASKPVGVL